MLSNICLKRIQISSKLQLAMKNIMWSENKKQIIKDGGILSSYLFKRDRPWEKYKRGLLPLANDDILNDEDLHKELFEKRWQKDMLEFKIIVYRRRHAFAYLSSRLNATYGAIYRVLNEIKMRRTDFIPETILDFGSGLGTSFWVIDELWGLDNKIMHHVDLSPSMLDMAKQLREAAGHVDEGFNISLRENEYLTSHGIYDIVIASYSLGELPSIELMRKTLVTLWKQTKYFLILIESGSKAGYLTLMDCRDLIINEMREQTSESNTDLNPIFAPCPHMFTCPLKEKGGCFFKQRTDLSIVQQKDDYYKVVSQKSHFNEKFCYIIFSKQKIPPAPLTYSRLVGPTLKKKRHIVCQLCTPEGSIDKRVFTKTKDKWCYKSLRKKSEWGDIIEIPASNENIDGGNILETQSVAT